MSQQGQRARRHPRPCQAGRCQAGQRGVSVRGVDDECTRRLGAAGQRVRSFLQWQPHRAQHGRQRRRRLGFAERHVAGQEQVAAIDLRGQAGVVDQAHGVGLQAVAEVLQRGAQVGAVRVLSQQHLEAAGAQCRGHRGAVALRRIEYQPVADIADAHHQRQALPRSRWRRCRSASLRLRRGGRQLQTQRDKHRDRSQAQSHRQGHSPYNQPVECSQQAGQL